MLHYRIHLNTAAFCFSKSQQAVVQNDKEVTASSHHKPWPFRRSQCKLFSISITFWNDPNTISDLLQWFVRDSLNSVATFYSICNFITNRFLFVYSMAHRSHPTETQICHMYDTRVTSRHVMSRHVTSVLHPALQHFVCALCQIVFINIMTSHVLFFFIVILSSHEWLSSWWWRRSSWCR